MALIAAYHLIHSIYFCKGRERLNRELCLGDFMAKPFLIERAPVVSGVLFMMGVVLTFVGLAGVFSPDLIGMGGMESVVLVVGILCLMIGLIWIVILQSKIRKFYGMLSENKKAAFIKNLDEVEYVAWRLPVRYEEELDEKKRKLGVR
jgi:hypothetical protein